MSASDTVAFINPRAGGVARLRRRPSAVDGVEQRWLDEPTALDRAIASFRGRMPRCVVVVGGDGTLSQVLTSIERERAHSSATASLGPTIALVPMGTMGTVAKSLGARRTLDVEHAIAAARDAASDPTRTREIGTISVGVDGAAARVGFIVAAGLAPSFFEIYDRSSATGVREALRLTARITASALADGPLARRVLAARPCAVTVDGSPRATPSVSLLVASMVRDVGLGFSPTYRASPEQARFHVVVSSAAPARLARAIPSMLLARPSSVFDEDVMASTVELGFASPGALVVDGDTLVGQRFVLRRGPRIRLASTTAP